MDGDSTVEDVGDVDVLVVQVDGEVARTVDRLTRGGGDSAVTVDQRAVGVDQTDAACGVADEQQVGGHVQRLLDVSDARQFQTHLTHALPVRTELHDRIGVVQRHEDVVSEGHRHAPGLVVVQRPALAAVRQPDLEQTSLDFVADVETCLTRRTCHVRRAAEPSE